MLGFAVFGLYLILANWLYTLSSANLPLGADVNNFIMPLLAVDIAVVNLYAVYRRRRRPARNAQSFTAILFPSLPLFNWARKA